MPTYLNLDKFKNIKIDYFYFFIDSKNKMFGALIGVSITASVASGGTVPITGAAVIGAIKLTALFWGWIYISNKIEMGAEKEKNLKKKIIILKILLQILLLGLSFMVLQTSF